MATIDLPAACKSVDDPAHPRDARSVLARRRLVEHDRGGIRRQHRGKPDELPRGEVQVVGVRGAHGVEPTELDGLPDEAITVSSGRPIRRGPKPTSRSTLRSKSWSSGLWNTNPTRSAKVG